MLSAKRASLWIRILALLILAAFSFFFLSKWIPETDYVQYSMEQIEEINKTILAFEAATLSASLAISALPDDFGSSYAEALTDLNVFFVLIMVILLVEKLLLTFGFQFAFAMAVPIACILCVLAILTRRDSLKSLGARLCILGLAVALAVPCSTFVTDLVAEDLTAYVEETIAETDSGAEKLNLAMVSDTQDKSIFDKLSDLFSTAIQGVTDLMQYFQNMITKCMYAIAIMLLKTIVMPILTFVFLKWVLNETLHIMAPVPRVMVVQEAIRGSNANSSALLEEAEALLQMGDRGHE